MGAKKSILKFSVPFCYTRYEDPSLFSSLTDLKFQRSALINDKIRKVKLGASEKEIYDINLSIAEKEAAENREKILKQFQYFSENPENIEMQKMWKCFIVYALR